MDDELTDRPIRESDDAARALTVVDAQKDQNLRVQLPAKDAQAVVEVSSARDGAYAFKAGSSLPEDHVEPLNTEQVFLVRYREELYAIPGDELRKAFPQLAAQYATRYGTIDLQKKLTVAAAITPNATPELIRSIGTTNIVRYDGYFYLLPQGLGAVKWGEENVAGLPGVTLVSSAREAFAIAEGGADQPKRPKTAVKSASKPATKGVSLPFLRKTVANYNIVEYEGWFYGLPQSLGPIDLERTDVIEVPGVIRDVSADVVEREILELKR